MVKVSPFRLRHGLPGRPMTMGNAMWLGTLSLLLGALPGCSQSVAAPHQSASTQAGITSPTPDQIGRITLGGVERTYVVFRPPSLDQNREAPLIIAMHGYTVDTTWMESNSHFDDLATNNGFVVVYPQGLGDAWNAGRCCGHDNNDDVEFIKAVIDRLVADDHVDPKRVFATGMSNGGLMAQRLACEAADRITAVTSVSGSLVSEPCNPSRPISVLEMHGLEDDLVPYKGGVVAGLTYFPPTMSNMQEWASRDGCAASPTVTQDGITTTYTWSGCRDGSSVVLDAIAGAGHSWFGPDDMPGEPDAAKVAWDFFSHAPPLP
jgi:polyhydroxybutyrate depolymerase